MKVLTTDPTQLFKDWPQNYEDAPPTIKALVEILHDFTDATFKRKLAEVQTLLPELSRCLNELHEALMGRRPDTGLNTTSYCCWLDALFVRPAIDKLEGFIKHHGPRDKAGKVGDHYVPLEHVLATWAKAFGALQALQYVLEMRWAPYLEQETEAAAV